MSREIFVTEVGPRDLSFLGPVHQHSEGEFRHLVAEKLEELSLLHTEHGSDFANVHILFQLNFLKVQLGWEAKLSELGFHRVTMVLKSILALLKEN